MVVKEKEYMTHMQHKQDRVESRDRLSNRKLEREIVVNFSLICHSFNSRATSL